MEDKSAEMPPPSDSKIPLQNYPYRPPFDPLPMHSPQMQHAPLLLEMGAFPGNPHYPGPPPQSQPYIPKQPDMDKPATSSPGFPAGHMSQQNIQYENIHETPSDYTFLSCFVCLCCCWPIGIVAIIYSLRVRCAVSSGNITEARRHSDRAKSCALFGICCGLCFGIFMLVSTLIRIFLLRGSNAHINYMPTSRTITFSGNNIY